MVTNCIVANVLSLELNEVKSWREAMFCEHVDHDVNLGHGARKKIILQIINFTTDYCRTIYTVFEIIGKTKILF